MDNLENVYIPDSPLSTYPDVMVNSGSETDSKSPNTKRRLVIKKKSPSTQNLTSLTAGDDQDRILTKKGSPLRMQQSFNCPRDTSREISKRRSSPREGLVSERLKQWKQNIAKEDSKNPKPTDSPLIARYKKPQAHSQPTTPTRPMNDISRRLRNPSVASTVSDTSSSGISDRSEILKSPISSSDASEIRTSPSSERSQPCYSVSSQESDHSLPLDSPVKSHVTTIVINPHTRNKRSSPSITTTRQPISTCSANKEKVRYYSEGSDDKPVSPVSITTRARVNSLNNTSPYSSNASSPTPSESGGSTTTPTDKVTFTPPPVIKPKPTLHSKPKNVNTTLPPEPTEVITTLPPEPTEVITTLPPEPTEVITTLPPEPSIEFESQNSKSSVEEVTPVVDAPSRGVIVSSPVDEWPTIETTQTKTNPTHHEPPQLEEHSTVSQVADIKEVSSGVEENVPISSYLQINTLSDRIFKKNLKRGLEFTILVVGESGLGKTTLIDSLFTTNRSDTKTIPTVQERKMKTTKIEKHQLEYTQRGVAMKINVIDTPGFGDAMDGTDCCVPILDHINSQFERFYTEESGMNRKHIHDNRVHACLYFISPNGHGLKPLDIWVMKSLCEVVNLIPVIGKADTLSEEEMTSLKEKVRQELLENRIDVYDCTADDNDINQMDKERIQNMAPYSVIGANTVITENGRSMLAREYPWGHVEIENPEHCNYSFLKSMLLGTHMSDLQNSTHEHLYEEFRKNQIEKNGARRSPEQVDTLLVEKELEIERMREQMLKMQQQLGISAPVTF